MQIRLNTDKNIEGREKLAEHVEKVVSHTLSHFARRITRVEVHLGDENGEKTSAGDKRCMMEARVEGRPPTAVTHHADHVDQAISGAADKLKRALERDLDRLEAR